MNVNFKINQTITKPRVIISLYNQRLVKTLNPLEFYQNEAYLLLQGKDKKWHVYYKTQQDTFKLLRNAYINSLTKKLESVSLFGGISDKRETMILNAIDTYHACLFPITGITQAAISIFKSYFTLSTEHEKVFAIVLKNALDNFSEMTNCNQNMIMGDIGLSFLIYFKRIMREGSLNHHFSAYLDILSIDKIFLPTLLLASKMSLDFGIANSELLLFNDLYNLDYLNELELRLLKFLKYELFISKEEMNALSLQYFGRVFLTETEPQLSSQEKELINAPNTFLDNTMLFFKPPSRLITTAKADENISLTWS